MEFVVVLGLITALALAAGFGRTSGDLWRARRSGAPKTTDQTQQDAGTSTKKSLSPYFWLYVAGGIVLGVIAVVVVLTLRNQPAVSIMLGSDPASDTGYPKLPSSAGEMWWILISPLALAALALLLRKQGTQPHLTAAAILGILAIVLFGVWLIQWSGASKKTPQPPPQSTRAPAPEQSVYLYPGQVWTGPGEKLVKAYRTVALEKQALVKIPSVSPGQKPYQLSWKRVGEPCAIENLVEQKGGPFGLEVKTSTIQLGPYEWEDERDHPKLTSVSARRFRPLGCDEVTIAVKIWLPQS